MQKSAHFRVDPKLTQVLGENYTSSEKALKQLGIKKLAFETRGVA